MRAVWLAVVLAGCNAYDTDLGPSPFLCGDDEPRCPMGYTCMNDPASGAEVCLASDESIGNVDCNDDSQYEPNNALAEAMATPVDTMKTFTLEDLAVCPAGDTDYFTITLSQSNEHIELILVYDAGGAVLRGELLNAGGIPIRTASSVTGQPNTLRGYTQNLPSGTYYARVSSASNPNNYKLTINVTGP